MSPRNAVLTVVLVSFALYAATPEPNVFSDGLREAQRIEQGPHLFYNVLYVPLAWAFHRALEPVFAWEAFEALRWFSMVCASLAMGVVLRLCLRVGCTPVSALGWSLLVAVSPGVWFFATSVEVHALQLLGAALATDLALAARLRTPRKALGFVVVGAALAVFTHLTSVLMVPVLALLARGAAPGLGLEWRPLLRPAALRKSAVGLGTGVLLVALAMAVTGSQAWTTPFQGLFFFGGLFLDRIARGVLFSPAEMADFLWNEVVLQAGVLLFLAAAFFFDRAERLRLALLLALAPYFLLLPQGGIRENGAYYLSLYPTLCVLAATALRLRASARSALPVALAVALALQAGWGAYRQSRSTAGNDARTWIRQVEIACPAESAILTVALPRWHAMSYSPKHYQGHDLNREYEMSPSSQWGRVTNKWIGLVASDLQAGKRVFLDAEVFVGPDRPEYFVRFERALEPLPVRLEAVETSDGEPLLFEILLEEGG